MHHRTAPARDVLNVMNGTGVDVPLEFLVLDDVLLDIFGDGAGLGFTGGGVEGLPFIGFTSDEIDEKFSGDDAVSETVAGVPSSYVGIFIGHGVFSDVGKVVIGLYDLTGPGVVGFGGDVTVVFRRPGDEVVEMLSVTFGSFLSDFVVFAADDEVFFGRIGMGGFTDVDIRVRVGVEKNIRDRTFLNGDRDAVSAVVTFFEDYGTDMHRDVCSLDEGFGGDGVAAFGGHLYTIRGVGVFTHASIGEGLELVAVFLLEDFEETIEIPVEVRTAQ